MNLTDTKIEPLGKDYSVVVSRDHTFGTDALLLADFVGAKASSKVCEFGSGCGIISVLLCKNGCKSVTAVELQQKAFEQLKQSVEINNLAECIFPVNADLRALKGVLEHAAFDIVCMNPPYKPVGSGIESVSEADKIARHETMCSIDDLTSAAAYLLKFGGKLCICHRPERLTDVLCSMRKNKIEPKRLRFVVQTEGKTPWLFLIEGRLGGKSGITVMPELVIKNPDGTNSEEMKRIFGDYTEGHEQAQK